MFTCKGEFSVANSTCQMKLDLSNFSKETQSEKWSTASFTCLAPKSGLTGKKGSWFVAWGQHPFADGRRALQCTPLFALPCCCQGEHKLVHFIRQQRTQPHYDPTTTHCIYGADADLLFLSLCTHEPKFYVLREDVREWEADTPASQRFCMCSMEVCGIGTWCW